ncbi:MAG: hypothetical protein ACREPY_08300, partial [Rhodanobacteraceae bacterium]
MKADSTRAPNTASDPGTGALDTERPLWFGRTLRVAVGALLLWYGVAGLQHADWLLAGILVAAAIPLVLTLLLFTYEVQAGHVLAPSQLFWWHRVYFIGALVGISLWHGVDVAAGAYAVFLGVAMLV